MKIIDYCATAVKNWRFIVVLGCGGPVIGTYRFRETEEGRVILTRRMGEASGPDRERESRFLGYVRDVKDGDEIWVHDPTGSWRLTGQDFQLKGDIVLPEYPAYEHPSGAPTRCGSLRFYQWSFRISSRRRHVGMAAEHQVILSRDRRFYPGHFPESKAACPLSGV